MQIEGKFTLLTLGEFDKHLQSTSFKRKVSVIQNHHTYLPGYKQFTGNNHFKMVAGMEAYHKQNGFAEIAQNITTFPDGTIMICRALDKVPAGIKGANQQGICIEHVGNFDVGGDSMTPEHRRTIIGVNALLCREFGIGIDTNGIVYHHWYDLTTGKRTNGILPGSYKTCPGTNFFGGNTVSDCQNNFLPEVFKYFNAIQNF